MPFILRQSLFFVVPRAGTVSTDSHIETVTVLLSAAPRGLGFVWALFDPDRLGWHGCFLEIPRWMDGKSVPQGLKAEWF
jgi:hypothetical protein